MQYFKTTDNQVWCFEDNVKDIYAFPNTPKDLIPISKTEADALNNISLTQEQKEEKLKSDAKIAIQSMLDTKAIEYGYDNVISVASYSSPTPLEDSLEEKFRREGNAFYTWRSACWRTSIAYMTEIEDAIALAKQKGEEYALPTVETVLAKMPTLDL